MPAEETELEGRMANCPSGLPWPGLRPIGRPISGLARCEHWIFLERKDVCIDTPDNGHETPLSLAFSRGHNGAVKILQELTSRRSNTADDAGQAIPSLSIGHAEECVIEMQSRGGDLDPDITDLEGLNAHSSSNPKKRKRISHCDE
ncbi:hypothetical protein L873DRAFT_1791835 [Choiromyces venosus 120613-1]|uniref:Ankyrin n=1 Tax=Choiromyces venosus 120613-1 TaxID=1336337 RepID=A0A3N4JHA9_9PEZI|nr:hypothetical protein L873DRAFT_1791835 [Choiromyces venosus 120613-1]